MQHYRVFLLKMKKNAHITHIGFDLIYGRAEPREVKQLTGDVPNLQSFSLVSGSAAELVLAVVTATLVASSQISVSVYPVRTVSNASEGV